MADHDTDIPAHDVEPHHATYEGFIAGTKYTVVGMVILLALMAIFL